MARWRYGTREATETPAVCVVLSPHLSQIRIAGDGGAATGGAGGGGQIRIAVGRGCVSACVSAHAAREAVAFSPVRRSRFVCEAVATLSVNRRGRAAGAGRRASQAAARPAL